MPSPQDPYNPFRSVLNSLKSRMAPEKELQRKWRDEPGELTADDYPVLNLLEEKKKPVPKSEPAGESPDARLKKLVQEGHLRKLDAEQLGQILREMLDGGFLESFVQAIEHIHRALESRAPDDRRWALESVRALISLEGPEPDSLRHACRCCLIVSAASW